jgi:hypothetical protein
MEKLETFFIKTVVDAQQQAQPTSGAVSKMEISDFLAAEAAKESILNKLVSAPVSRPKPPQAVTTEKVVPVETAKSEPDDELLRKLSKTDKSDRLQPVARDRKIKTQPVETKESESEKVNKDVLDQLMGRSTPQKGNSEQQDKSRGQKSD